MAPTPPPLSTHQTASPHPTPSNPAARRIRENQRRSRARRKEYMHDLEHKLRNCEQAGVTASVDIQLAARVVAEENRRLREENGRLRDEGAALKEENERLRGVMMEKERGGGPAEGTGGALGAGAREGEHVPLLQSSMPGHTTTVQSKEVYASHLPHTQPEANSEIPCAHNNSEMVLGEDDTSSCEYAAQIITSMRADASADDVRADLGCGGDVRGWRACKVDNSRLFVAVDRWVG